jgi:transcription initiation factor TFIIB
MTLQTGGVERARDTSTYQDTPPQIYDVCGEILHKALADQNPRPPITGVVLRVPWRSHGYHRTLMHAKSRPPAGESSERETVFSRPEQPPAPNVDAGAVCPECRQYVKTVDTSEAVCPECDLVVTTSPISTDPLPRYDDGVSRARTGSRVTNLYADRGIGVGISENVITDGNGAPLEQTQRRVAREKPWTKHRTSEEVRMDYALGEIRRMGAPFNLPNTELERAAHLYRRAHAEGVIEGRSVEGFATASLLTAIRQSSISFPVSTAELSQVTRATDEQIRVARGVLEHRLDVEIPPMKPHEFLPKITSELGTPRHVRRCAETLLKGWEADQKKNFRGISPRTLAAAALHAAYDITDCSNRPTLSKLSAASGVSHSTISQRKGCLLKYRSE